MTIRHWTVHQTSGDGYGMKTYYGPVITVLKTDMANRYEAQRVALGYAMKHDLANNKNDGFRGVDVKLVKISNLKAAIAKEEKAADVALKEAQERVKAAAKEQKKIYKQAQDAVLAPASDVCMDCGGPVEWSYNQCGTDWKNADPFCQKCQTRRHWECQLNSALERKANGKEILDDESSWIEQCRKHLKELDV